MRFSFQNIVPRGRTGAECSTAGSIQPVAFELPPQGEPLACHACTCWRSEAGLPVGVGRCVCSGRRVDLSSLCDRGLEDWQAAPLEERTAPQPGQEVSRCA